jgi:hypothetical protein
LIGTIQNVKIMMKHTERRLAATAGRILHHTKALCTFFACRFTSISRLFGSFLENINLAVALNRTLRVHAQ